MTVWKDNLTIWKDVPSIWKENLFFSKKAPRLRKDNLTHSDAPRTWILYGSFQAMEKTLDAWNTYNRPLQKGILTLNINTIIKNNFQHSQPPTNFIIPVFDKLIKTIFLEFCISMGGKMISFITLLYFKRHQENIIKHFQDWKRRLSVDIDMCPPYWIFLRSRLVTSRMKPIHQGDA